MAADKSPFHDLIIDIQQLKDHRDPAPLFGHLDGDLLNGEYHFTSSEKTLTFMSRRIENACFADPGRCSLYSVFRRLSLLEPHLEHYHKLDAARHVYVIGRPDVPVEPWANNVHVISAKAELLASNWMTINISRDIHMTLLAEELEPSDDGERRYVGFYTDSRALTRRVVRQLVEMGIIGQPELFKEEQLEFGGDLAPPAS